jgi:hypothetical protein
VELAVGPEGNIRTELDRIAESGGNTYDLEAPRFDVGPDAESPTLEK